MYFYHFYCELTSFYWKEFNVQFHTGITERYAEAMRKWTIGSIRPAIEEFNWEKAFTNTNIIYSVILNIFINLIPHKTITYDDKKDQP